MSSESQDTTEDTNFLAFDAIKNSDDNNKYFRNNFQYRPYNRQQNYRNQHFRRDQFNSPNEEDAQFSPANFSSPVGGYQQRFNKGYRNRPNHMNQRNFSPHFNNVSKLVFY